MVPLTILALIGNQAPWQMNAITAPALKKLKLDFEFLILRQFWRRDCSNQGIYEDDRYRNHQVQPRPFEINLDDQK